MLLLVTDTSGRNGSVALASAEVSKPEVHVIERVPLAGGTFSAQLVPQIASLLSKHDFRKSDIGAFIVVSGPGSFTGLRVGLAAIKGLAVILEKPIVPVSLLEVIAVASSREGSIVAALDAGRGEFYAAEYEVRGNDSYLAQEQLLSRDELLSERNDRAISTPDPLIAEIAREAGIRAIVIEPIGTEMIARLGWRKLQAGETVTPEALDANYIRRSVSEIYPKSTST